MEEQWLRNGQITRSSSRICSKHFGDNDFTNCWKEKLNRGVVPSQNGPSISSRPPQASDKAVIVDCFSLKQSPLSLDYNFIKEENTSDEFHFEVTEENFETDEPENVSEYPIAQSNEDFGNRNPTLCKTVTMVSAGNCEEDIGNKIGSGSDCEDAPSKKSKVSFSDIHEMHYRDLVSAKNDLNCVYMKVIEKSAEILEKIPTHILKEITGLDSSIFIEMKSIRKMLSAKQKLIRSYLKSKESEDVLNSDSSEIQRLSKDTRAWNENLSVTSLTSDSLNQSGKQCKNQAQTPSFSSSASVQLSQSPLIKVREITQLSSVNFNTLQNALSSESSSDWNERDRVLTNSEKSRQSYDVTGNSFTGSGPFKFGTSSLKTNSRTAISQDCPVLPIESTMKSNIKIVCETSVDANGTKAPFVQEMSGTSECNQADKITPLSLKASLFNHCLPAFQPKGDHGGEEDSYRSPYFKSRESAGGPSKVTRESKDVTTNKVKKRAETNAATKSGGVTKARARKVDGMATSKNSSSSEANKTLS
ncbi:hypothetical protein J437_LFUL013029 [Ladona fulva]|uniref:THAP-type domain-containing protein n=1 Tax=Ladona fulva TaxID=123851 RepID=A0A8K0P9Z8_LADFU|nr:hypothetical protein J437_LFUL013029 [Ladona fulva]